jgi:hypothetical protein
MCDFAEDPEQVRKLLVGRVLTVERVRQLNAKPPIWLDYLVAKGELQHRVEIYGGAGTCFGMNPQAIRITLQYPNMKMIWFPTFTSLGFWRGAGQPEKGGVRLVSESGQVLPEVVEIMELASDKKVGSASGIPITGNCCRWRKRPMRSVCGRHSITRCSS